MSGTEKAEETEEASEDLPEIEEDEQADLDGLDLDVDPADIEDDVAGDPSEEEGQSGADGGSDTDTTMSGGETWGDMYVEGLATSATILREEFGDGTEVDPDRARELHLDSYFNEFVEERGANEDMPPEQALLVGTCLFLMGSLATDSELMETALGEVSG